MIEVGHAGVSNSRLWKRFQMMAALPEKDQRAVIRLIGSLVSLGASRRLPAAK
jgi:hypothetical protein